MSTIISTTDVLAAFYVMIPAYLANGAPVIFGRGRPIDLGRNFLDGRRILGDNKTIRGLMSGLLAGFLASAMEDVFLGRGLLVVGALATTGAALGDLLGAFLKRRLGIPAGGPLPVVDQLDFILGALALTYPVYSLPLGSILILVTATPPIHFATNVMAYMLKLKRTYW